MEPSWYCWVLKDCVREERCMHITRCTGSMCRKCHPVQLMLFTWEELDACSCRYRN